ncbi:hypothetical protein FQA39_LY16918 [Lamprigera yunnana]|nr:hypothetical protein FQA39_LY16918 [Lamprigera yunnana]
MLLLLLAVLFFHTISCSLTVSQEKFTLKTCVQNIIKNYINVDTTVLYVYNKTSDNILPQGMQNPIITMNSRNIIIPSKYKGYELLIIINTRPMNLKQFKVDLGPIQGLWKEDSLIRRHYLIICSLKETRLLKNVFFYFWKKHILDVIIMAYDFDFKNDSIMVVTSDPHHNLNLCGTALNYVEQRTCQTIQPVRGSRTFKKLNFCNITYIVKSKSQSWEKHSSEQTFVSRFVVDTIIKALNVTFTLKEQSNVNLDGDEFKFRTSELRNCFYKFRSCGPTYTKNIFVCSVPSAKRMSSMEVFKITFKPIVWMLILVFFLLTSIIWWFISKLEYGGNFSYTLLNVYSITLFGSLNRTPTYVPLRFMFIAYVMYAVHIQVGITSNLINLLTRPQYHPSIKSIEELSQSDLSIWIDESYGVYFQGGDDAIVHRKLKEKCYFVDSRRYTDALYIEETYEKYSVFFMMKFLQHVIQNKKIKMNLLMNDPILPNQPSALATKSGSYLIFSLNRIVNILLESDLIGYQEKEYHKYIRQFSHEQINELEDKQPLGSAPQLWFKVSPS